MADTEAPHETEAERVRRWRFLAAKHAGLNFDKASAFADGDEETELLRKCEKGHATPDQIWRIMN